jgi:two-component system, cell cycle response regulator
MTDDARGENRPSVPTILVVDDSTAIRRILGRALSAAGYRVVEAADGSAALDACRAEQPDLVLLDIDMPVMDGHATLREMRADPHLRAIPVLFLTARTAGADVAAGLELGAQDYLRKPCEPAELTARVGMALRAKAVEHALERQARELSELSITDALTGLGNRRYIAATIGELVVTRGPDAAVGVIMIDVDHFKSVNDQYGHPVGDVVLRIVAQRLRATVDARLMLARWGGEEFLLVGIGFDSAEVSVQAEHAREVVGANPFATGIDQTVAVTISAGCAVGTLAGFTAAIEAADGALYEAKRSGRNRVVFASAANSTQSR